MIEVRVTSIPVGVWAAPRRSRAVDAESTGQSSVVRHRGRRDGRGRRRGQQLLFDDSRTKNRRGGGLTVGEVMGLVAGEVVWLRVGDTVGEVVGLC